MELANTEIVIALSSAIGTNSALVIEEFVSQLAEFSYEAIQVKLSDRILAPMLLPDQMKPPVIRANAMMDLGNKLRTESGDGAILASAAIDIIQKIRKEKSKNPDDPEQMQRTAFIISSLKHPDEVVRLRETYGNVFFLIAISENEGSRLDYLNKKKNLGHSDALTLIERDEGENDKLGQQTRSVFELADIHISLNNPHENTPDNSYLKSQVTRVLNLMFGHPFITPTIDEYAMFVAYASSLRSADLGRQVGAVITNPYGEIIATGANDVPKYGGGQYWPDSNTYIDSPEGRDYRRSLINKQTDIEIVGYDANKREHIRIVEEILDMFEYKTSEDGTRWKEDFQKKLLASSIKYLTEYARAVHAEMAAIIACSRNGISLQDSTLYCTTFPCHNCAKHIVHAGLKRVVYIEPYPKSKTLDLFNDTVSIGRESGKVSFEEFIGVGPRRFFDFFSLQLSTGRRIIRKEEDNGGPADGRAVKWDRSHARLRFQATALSYIEKEAVESAKWELLQKKAQMLKEE